MHLLYLRGTLYYWKSSPYRRNGASYKNSYPVLSPGGGPGALVNALSSRCFIPVQELQYFTQPVDKGGAVAVMFL